jgi:glycosyltransferase involved in cell wall biosynthesis
MPSFTYFLKKIENNPNVHIIFLVKKKLFLANKLILKKKVKNFDKEIIFINEYYFLKNRKFKKIFQILNEIFKFFYITFFIINKNVKNLKVDTSSLIPCYFISKIINVSINLRLYGSYTLNFQKKKKNLYSYLFRKACKMNFNSVICTKDGNADYNSIKELFINTKKFEVSFNGSNFKNFRSRKNYNLDKPFNILFIGRLNHLKGPLHLLEAVKKLRNTKRINLTIVGNGDQLEKIIRYVKKNQMMSIFNFYKKLDHYQIRDKMRNSDLLISPSFIGYFSNVVIEATSMGLAVMTCKDKYKTINNCKFNYLQNKHCFQLNNKNNISDQIYKNLIKIINNPEKLVKMSNLEKKISKKNFLDWSHVINNELKLTNFI